MNFGNPQMKVSRLGNAVRPWQSLDSTPTAYPKSPPIGVRPISQSEIDACLNCPYPNCDGKGNLCREYRLHFIAKMEGREP